jgi:cell division protease FtsH
MVSDISLAILALIAVSFAVFAALQDRKRRMAQRPTCADLVKKYFAPIDVHTLITVSRTFPSRVRADLQLSLENALKDGNTIQHFTGMQQQFAHVGIEFNGLLGEGHTSVFTAAPQYQEVDIGGDTPVRCMTNGLWLLKNEVRFAVLMASAEKYGQDNGQDNGIRLELAVPAGHESIIDKLFKKVEDGIARSGSYRGKVLSLEKPNQYTGQSNGITVHRLRPVTRDQIILPARTLDYIDRNILKFVEQRSNLVAMGLAAKKGLLFYGPPGTGKTHTLHYLVNHLKGHTFLLISAEQQGLLSDYMSLARLLQPAVIVIEDADLIARNRDDSDGPCVESLLNKLLNEMDGLHLDAEILFVLTTNRPESLEPALVARPGRVDQAIEFPIPDSPCRDKLVRLYAGPVKLDENLIATVVSRTEGVSAAFIKEFVRRAAQHALEHGRKNVINADDAEAALQEMLHQSNRLNARLLGAAAN